MTPEPELAMGICVPVAGIEKGGVESKMLPSKDHEFKQRFACRFMDSSMYWHK